MNEELLEAIKNLGFGNDPHKTGAILELTLKLDERLQEANGILRDIARALEKLEKKTT